MLNKKYAIAGLAAGFAILLDQVSKAIVVAKMPLHKPIVIIDGFVNLIHVRNEGAAFGIMSQMNTELRGPFFAIVSILALGLVCFYLYKTRNEQRLLALSLGLILGGAAGNIIDRVRMGYVVDFIDVFVSTHHWPTFNMSDTAISIGIFFMAIEIIILDPTAFSEPTSGKVASAKVLED